MTAAKKIASSLLLLLALAQTACNRGDQKVADTATTGEINLAVDESFMPLADAELQAFHGLYKRAHINAAYKPEAEIVKDLQNDSARAIMITRVLTPQEMEVFEKRKL